MQLRSVHAGITPATYGTFTMSVIYGGEFLYLPLKKVHMDMHLRIEAAVTCVRYESHFLYGPN